MYMGDMVKLKCSDCGVEYEVSPLQTTERVYLLYIDDVGYRAVTVEWYVDKSDRPILYESGGNYHCYNCFMKVTYK